MSGLIHIYCGDGKGKTTSATGLAIRAAGAGKKVVFTQFLKDGSSSEIKILRELSDISVYTTCHCGFFESLTKKEKQKAQDNCIQLFKDAISSSKEDVNLLILDEIICAIEYKVIPEEILIEFLETKPHNLEVVLTGRNPSDKLLSMAHYITRMQKIKHPYDNNIVARLGIEF